MSEIVVYYFSAHWCAPCREFTPILIEFYNFLAEQNKNLTVVFVSSDRSTEAFEQYRATMPQDWKAVSSEDPMKLQLIKEFEISGIPRLVITKQNGEIINQSARVQVLDAMLDSNWKSAASTLYKKWTDTFDLIK